MNPTTILEAMKGGAELLRRAEIVKCKLGYGVFCYHHFTVRRLTIPELIALKPGLKDHTKIIFRTHSNILCEKFDEECIDELIKRAVNKYVESIGAEGTVQVKIANGCCTSETCPHYLLIRAVYDVMNSSSDDID